MKKLFVILFFIPFFSVAQTNWSLSSNGYNVSLPVKGIAITTNNDVFVTTIEYSTVRLYKSTDAGTNWSEVMTTGLPNNDSPVCLGVNGSVLYMGFYSNIYKSTDAGLTWTNTGYATTLTPQSIIADDNNNLFVSAVYYDGGNGSSFHIKLFTSANSGDDWVEIPTSYLPYCTTARIAMKGSKMYLGTTCGYGIYESDDNSEFYNTTGFPNTYSPQSMLIDDNDNVFAAGTRATIDGENYVYTIKLFQKGESVWNELSLSGLPQSSTTLLAAKGINMYLGLSTGIYKSTNYTTSVLNGVNQNNYSVFYPNPASKRITLEERVAHAELYTTQGQSILYENITNSTLDISAVANGMYIIRGFDREGKLLFSKKLLVNNQ